MGGKYKKREGRSRRVIFVLYDLERKEVRGGGGRV